MSLKCPVCGVTYKRVRAFIRHLMVKHNFVYIDEKVEFKAKVNYDKLLDNIGELMKTRGWVRVDFNHFVRELDFNGYHVRVEVIIRPWNNDVLVFTDNPIPPDKYHELKDTLVEEVRSIVEEAILKTKEEEIEEKSKIMKEYCMDYPCEYVSDNLLAITIPGIKAIILYNTKTQAFIWLSKKMITKLNELIEKADKQ